MRERKEDIVPLAELFIKKYSDLYHKQPLVLDDKARHELIDCQWAGNVRELEHAMERSVILETFEMPTNTIQPIHPSMGQGESLASMERNIIAQAIRECEGNLSIVAQRLDISRQTLYNKIKKYGL